MTNRHTWARLAVLILPLLVTALPTAAQQRRLFTLEDLNFGGTNYHNLRPKTLHLTWWGDQLMYQDAEDGGLLGTDGSHQPRFTLDELGQGWHSAMNAQYPYADQPLVMLRNARERVLYNYDTHRVEWRQTASPDEQHPAWSKASRAVAFTRDDQLFVRTADGQERQLTTDGSHDIVYGDAVHRNEWGIDGGLFWSNDGQRLAFYRMDQSMVTDYPQVDTDPRVALLQPDKYPMAGMNTHVVTIGVYDLSTGNTLYLNTPTVDPAAPDSAATAQEQAFAPVYFTNIAWSPDAKTIYVQELNRDQNDCRLVAYSADSGERLEELYRETSPKYVEPQHPVRFVPWAAHLMLLQSQRDGYNHLWLFDLRSRRLTQLTSGQWVVMQVLGFNERLKSVIIASNERSPLQRNLYAVSLQTGRRTLLDNGEGVHRAQLSPSGERLIDRYSTPTVPNAINVIDLATLRPRTLAGTPRTTSLLVAPDPWADFVVPRYESGSIRAADDSTTLYYRMVKPADFDPARKYPTVVYVYGGPHAHNVDASWHWASRSWETYMAQRGYIVFVLDNRGSENRGRDFEQATFRQLGQLEMQDQMRGVDFLRSLPYVDADRLGVHGWSYGGFMTISLMLNHPDVFKVGVAGGPVIDWQWYEVMYGERYMDTPQQNPDGYALTSLVGKAANLRGRLQIIIGANDPTVVPQHALSFLKACVEAGTQPDFFVYPGEGHNMMGHASVHLHERITRYFDDYLK